MKKFRKLIPMALLAVAIAGAFSSHAMTTKKELTNFPGYTRNALGTVCNVSIQCSDIAGPLCMVGSTQIWGKDASGKCVVELHRVP